MAIRYIRAIGGERVTLDWVQRQVVALPAAIELQGELAELRVGVFEPEHQLITKRVRLAGYSVCGR